MAKEKKQGFISKITELLFDKSKINLISDDVIEKVIDSLSTTYDPKVVNSFSELVGAIIYDGDDDKLDDKNMKKILGDMSLVDLIGADVEYRSRINRYKETDSVIKSIPRLKKALDVLCSNVYAPDYISKDTYTFQTSDEDLSSRIIDESSDRFEDLDKKVIKVGKHGKNIIKKTIKYGDCFVEVYNVKSDIQNKREVLMLSNETDGSSNKIDKSKLTVEYEARRGSRSSLKNKKEYSMNLILENFNGFTNFILENSEEPSNGPMPGPAHDGSLQEVTNKEQSIIKKKLNKKRKPKSLKDFNVRVLEPERVVKLGNEEVCFGYLVFPRVDFFANIQTGTPLDNVGSMMNVLDGDMGASQQISRRLAEEILSKLRLKIGDIINELDRDGLETLNKLMQFMILNTSTVKDKNLLIRYVPETHMEHFLIDMDKYAPYGTSYVDGIIFDAKLLLGGKTAMMIDRISKSRDQQIAYVDIDFTNETADYIQQFKRARIQKKIALDDSTTIDAIPSMISNFEMIYLPKKNEKRYIELDTLPRADITPQTDDLKFQRDEMVAGINIPPPYLGIEDNIESKATLSFENIIFASMILDYQKEFSEHFTSLFQKAYALVHGEYCDYIDFVLNPPILLIVQTVIDYINNFTGVYDFLTTQLGLDKVDVISRFMPYIREYFDDDKIFETKIKRLKDSAAASGSPEGGAAGGEGGEFGF